MKSVKIMYLINAVISLIIGGILYLFLREGTYINMLFPFVEKLEAESIYGINFLRFYFPDWLWSYSLTFTIALFYDGKIKILVPVLLGFFFELFQVLKIVNGTFDFVDIVMYISACLCAEVIINIIKRRKYQ